MKFEKELRERERDGRARRVRPRVSFVFSFAYLSFSCPAFPRPFFFLIACSSPCTALDLFSNRLI